MCVIFTGPGETDYLLAANPGNLAQGPLTLNTPFTFSAWYKTDDILAIYDVMSTEEIKSLRAPNINGGVKPPGIAWGDASTANRLDAATATEAGVWHHLCGIWASTTDRRLILDGTARYRKQTSFSLNHYACVYVGRAVHSGIAHPMKGRIAAAACWNAVLTNRQVAQLGAGRNPLEVRGTALAGYWPLVDSGARAAGNWDMIEYDAVSWDALDNPTIITGGDWAEYSTFGIDKKAQERKCW